MRMNKKERRSLKRDIKEGGDRSRLFWWLVDNASEFLDEAANGRIGWEPHLRRFERLQITDTSGKIPTAVTARKTWYRVRQYLAKQNAPLPAKYAPVPPSRAAATWKPPVAKTQPAAAQVAAVRREQPEPPDWPSILARPPVSTEAGAKPPGGRQPISAEEKERIIKGLRRTFAERDGRKFVE